MVAYASPARNVLFALSPRHITLGLYGYGIRVCYLHAGWRDMVPQCFRVGQQRWWIACVGPLSADVWGRNRCPYRVPVPGGRGCG